MSLPNLPRPATVLASAALVIALTGSAIAAKKYVITSKKQIAPKVFKQLTGKTGPAGAKGDTGSTGATGPAGAKGDTGATGAKGDTGAAGANGTNGTNGTSATGGGMGASPIDSAQTYFPQLNAGYNNGSALQSANEAGSEQITPNAALVLTDFAMSVEGLAGSESVTITVRVNHADSAVTCTVTAPASLCTSAATLNLPPRSLVGVKLVANTLAARRFPSWSWTFA